jgi:ribonuclease-3
MTTQKFEQLTGKWLFFWGSYREEFAQLAVLETKINYTFKNRDLLYEAMTHRSAIHYPLYPQATQEKSLASELPWNERMEFLGDSVLSLIVSSMLWNRNSLDEGQLSQVKASLVSEASLAKLGEHLGVHHCLTVGKVERKTGNHLRPSLLADALEALIGAIYLDSSYDVVSNCVQTWFIDFFPIDEDVQDAKTRLQEIYQARFQKVPEYQTVEELGPCHAKTFRVAVLFDGQKLAEAHGTSKKRASQAAAKIVLENWTEAQSGAQQ